MHRAAELAAGLHRDRRDRRRLPGSSFIVNGAAIPHDSALTTAGAELFLAPNWSVIGKFEGEFASGSQTSAGTGTLRYTR